MKGDRIARIYGFVIQSLAVAGFTAGLYVQAASEFRSHPQHVAAPAAPEGVIGADGVIGAEDRKLLSQFTLDGVSDQAAMRTSLAATQRLSCDNGNGSASLIYRKDVIIFSAHQLSDDDGKFPSVPGDCVFSVLNKDGDFDHYPLLLATVDYGASVPPGQTDNRADRNDWAVARLVRPVEGIEPYALPDRPDSGTPGTLVTTVSEPTDNWRGPKGKLAQNCHVIDVEAASASSFPSVMHLDCDVGKGASGSAILTDVASGVPRYVGTTIAYRGNHCRESGLTSCFSIGRRLDADLIARIKGTTALRLTAEDNKLGAAQDARLAAARDAAATRAMAAVSAAFPAQDDAEGHKAADLYAQIKALVADGHPDQTDALFLEIYRSLHDPAQSRPEWPSLLLENGESMLRQHRQADAFQCFHAALAIAPNAMKPYALIRVAQTAIDPKVRKTAFREAYLAGGDRLFEAANAAAELVDVKASGILVADR
jgi:hypothetical protein